MNDTIELLVATMCRKLLLVPQEQVEVAGITGLRFRPHPDVFNYEAKENECFCAKDGEASQGDSLESFGQSLDDWFVGGGSSKSDEVETDNVQEESCQGRGYFEVGPCQFGAPIVMSWPHFMDADNLPPSFTSVEGYAPDRAKHDFTMDVEPTMGISLAVKVRMQINLKIIKTPALPQLTNLPLNDTEELLVPLMWFDSSIEKPPDNLSVLLRDALATGDNISRAVLIVGLVSLVGQLVLFMCITKWLDSHQN